MTDREKIVKPSKWKQDYQGNLFQILRNEKGWEKAVRAPGVRLILDDREAGKILLTREFRAELNDYDFRLPGGKVFDSLAEYNDFSESGGDIDKRAIEKVVAEAREETGYDIANPELIAKSVLGATVEWDLFVFAVTDFSKRASGQELEEGEEIETDLWFSYEEVKQMILNGSMREERIALVLFRYLEYNHQ